MTMPPCLLPSLYIGKRSSVVVAPQCCHLTKDRNMQLHPPRNPLCRVIYSFAHMMIGLYIMCTYQIEDGQNETSLSQALIAKRRSERTWCTVVGPAAASATSDELGLLLLTQRSIQSAASSLIISIFLQTRCTDGYEHRPFCGCWRIPGRIGGLD